MSTVTVNRIKEAIKRADAAFWKALEKSFPDAEPNELLPELMQAFDEAVIRVVTAWVALNLVEKQQEVTTKVHVSKQKVETRRYVMKKDNDLLKLPEELD